MKKTSPLLAKRSADDMDLQGESSRRRLNSPSEESVSSTTNSVSSEINSGNNIDTNTNSNTNINTDNTNTNSNTNTNTDNTNTSSNTNINTDNINTNIPRLPERFSGDDNPEAIGFLTANPNILHNLFHLYYKTTSGISITRGEIQGAARDLRTNGNPSFAAKRVAYLCDDFTPNPNRR
jgi:hypothetical protein